MPRAERAGKDARGTRKLIVSSLAAARDRTTQGPTRSFVPLTSAVRLISPTPLQITTDRTTDRTITGHRLGVVRSTERTERKKGPQSNVFEPLTALRCSVAVRRSAVSADSPFLYATA
jgi:hypothetical protein